MQPTRRRTTRSSRGGTEAVSIPPIVVIVDPSMIDRALMRRALILYGAENEIIEFATAEEEVAWCKTRPDEPKLTFLSISEDDKGEPLALLKVCESCPIKDRCHTVVVLADHLTRAQRQSMRDHGIVAYIEKPLNALALDSAIKMVDHYLCIVPRPRGRRG
jgi:DNA-binding NarL/FixJ family response regulator